MDDTHSNAETFSVLSADQQSVQSASIEQNLQSDVKSQQQELERLREQQSLLKKIVQQQKEVCIFIFKTSTSRHINICLLCYFVL